MEYQIINEIMVIDHNCINKQIVKKIRKYIAPAVKYPIAIGIILVLVLEINSFFRNLPNSIYFLLIILFIFYYYFLLNISVKNTFLEYKLIFDEEKLVYINNNINIPIKYVQIEKII